MKSEVEINYLFVRYVQQCIRYSSNSCLKKNQKYSTHYFPTDLLEETMFNTFYDNYFSIDSIKEADIDSLESFTEDESLSQAIKQLAYSEKKLLFKKYIQCQTDYEIANEFSMTRQGVSIKKKRLLKKLEAFLKR